MRSRNDREEEPPHAGGLVTSCCIKPREHLNTQQMVKSYWLRLSLAPLPARIRATVRVLAGREDVMGMRVLAE
jgi:hypothetical protein